MNRHLKLVGEEPPVEEVPVEAMRATTTFRAYMTPMQRQLLAEWLRRHGVDYSFNVEVD